MKNILVLSILFVFFFVAPSTAADIKGTLNKILLEEQIVVIDHRQYRLSKDAVIRWQSDANMLVPGGSGLHGRSVLYDLVQSGGEVKVQQLIILDTDQ